MAGHPGTPSATLMPRRPRGAESGQPALISGRIVALLRNQDIAACLSRPGTYDESQQRGEMSGRPLRAGALLLAAAIGAVGATLAAQDSRDTANAGENGSSP